MFTCSSKNSFETKHVSANMINVRSGSVYFSTLLPLENEMSSSSLPDVTEKKNIIKVHCLYRKRD